MGKKKITAVVKAAAGTAGNQMLSPEIQIANLKALNNILVKNTVEHREEIHELRSKLDSLGAERAGIESDLDLKRKELRDLEESIHSMECELGHTLKQREIVDANCEKLEQELLSVMLDKDLLKICREDDNHLVDKLVKEHKANVSKISALNEKCHFLEENNMASMASLQVDLSELQYAKKSLEDAHCSCIQNIATLQMEKNFKAEEALTLSLQLNDSIQNLEVLQKMLNLQTRENEETKKHINSLLLENASLEKQIETSNQGLEDIKKKFKLMQLSIASSNNKGGKWDWFFPATTIIVAAVSLAYKGGRR